MIVSIVSLFTQHFRNFLKFRSNQTHPHFHVMEVVQNFRQNEISVNVGDSAGWLHFPLLGALIITVLTDAQHIIWEYNQRLMFK